MGGLIGRELNGRYFLRELIGSSRTAEVYLAFDKLRASLVAVKVLRPDLFANPRFLRMFEQDALLLRQLQHPNIVRLYEFELDKENKLAFLVMDWVKGRDLRDAIVERQSPYSVQETGRVLEAVSAALHYAHQNEVYHCDVKPSNVLLHEDGRILLTDFGVARRVGYEDLGGGTPAYMAPEQLLNQPVDARTDIYALGVTLYEMLSGGQLPFRGDSPTSVGNTTRERIIWEHLNQPPPPLRRFNPLLPPAIEDVILLALRKRPDERFQTVLALREAFEQAQWAGEPRFSREPDPNPTILGSVRPPLVPEPPSELQPPTYVGKPHLVGLRGEKAGIVIVIPQSGLTIGRARDRRLRLTEKSVSRIHAVIIYTRHGIYLRDEGSRLGTFVNGQQLWGPIKLRSGDVVRIGYYDEFEFREA